MVFDLVVPACFVKEMIQHAQQEQPLECCGLLAGTIDEQTRVGVVVKRYPLVNELASPVAYLSEPRSMFEAVRDMLREGIDVLAVYHSHPTSAPIPSKTDLAQNYSPDVVNLIISLADDAPTVRGWWLREDGYTEAAWTVDGVDGVDGVDRGP
jgi:proteasome lid subunit RPN8/RPN11